MRLIYHATSAFATVLAAVIACRRALGIPCAGARLAGQADPSDRAGRRRRRGRHPRALASRAAGAAIGSDRLCREPARRRRQPGTAQAHTLRPMAIRWP
jgi:hypothetical protein